MTENPKLHIPQPTARPGDPPDFSYLDLSPAGAVERPPVDAAVRQIEHLASEMVRVLDALAEEGALRQDLQVDGKGEDWIALVELL